MTDALDRLSIAAANKVRIEYTLSGSLRVLVGATKSEGLDCVLARLESIPQVTLDLAKETVYYFSVTKPWESSKVAYAAKEIFEQKGLEVEVAEYFISSEGMYSLQRTFTS